jgi:hypothetical protein
MRTYNTKARYQFTPNWRDAGDPFAVSPDAWSWNDASGLTGGLPYREQYTPSYGPVWGIDEFQIARLPRGDSMLLAAVINANVEGFEASSTRRGIGRWETGLVATINVPPRSAGDVTIVRTRSDQLARRQVLSAIVPIRSIFAAIEILTPDTVGFARLRGGIPVSPWLEGRRKLSDIVLFAPDAGSLPGSSRATVALDSIMRRAASSTTAGRGSPLGLYWETQVDDLRGLPSEATVTLSIERRSGKVGFFGQLLGAIFGGGNAGVRGTTWNIGVPQSADMGTVRWGNSVSIATNSLTPGDYLIAIEVSGISEVPLVTKRSITILK